MKKSFTLFIFLMSVLHLSAQERYLDEVFTDVMVMEDIVYGVNATVLLLPIAGEAVPQPLAMDVYMPEGDTETERPLVLVFHTGNFLPSVLNGQISGTKSDSSVVEICTMLARRGYVAASVDYRLGWNPLAQDKPEQGAAQLRQTPDGSRMYGIWLEESESGSDIMFRRVDYR